MASTISSRQGRIFVSLGSNIEPRTHLPRALHEIAQRLELVATSRVFESAAKGAPGSPVFWNAAVEVRSNLRPRELKFEVLRVVEAKLGRVRTDDRNQPRTLDLDLAIYGDQVVADLSAGLVLPDPDILTCAHVAVPLADLASDLPHPVTGVALGDIAKALSADGGLSVVPGVLGFD